MTGKRKCDIYTHNQILFNLKTEQNPTICSIIDGPWGYYVKWNKSVTERQTLYNYTYAMYLKLSNSEMHKVEW